MVNGKLAAAYTIYAIVILLVIVYIIVLFETYKKGVFIFKPLGEIPLLPNFYHPLGNVTPLTQEEIDERNKIING